MSATNHNIGVLLLLLCVGVAIALQPPFAHEQARLHASVPIPKAHSVVPPLQKDIGTRAEVFEFLASPLFATTYWETNPLLIRTTTTTTNNNNDNSNNNGAFDDVLSLEDHVLASTYAVRGDKRTPPHRNVRFVSGGKFYREAHAASALGHADDSMVGREQLLHALATNHTLQFYGAQRWWRRVGQLCMNLSLATALPTNVNVYVTPPAQAVSLSVHNDFTCNFMVQLHGMKRWRLWKVPEFWLPVSEE